MHSLSLDILPPHTLLLSITLTLYQYSLQNSTHHGPSLPPITSSTLGTTLTGSSLHWHHPSPSPLSPIPPEFFIFVFCYCPLPSLAPSFLGHLSYHQLIHKFLVMIFFPFIVKWVYRSMGFGWFMGQGWLLLCVAVDVWDRRWVMMASLWLQWIAEMVCGLLL